MSDQTLHEFVLNLLSDEAAKSSFAGDPTAALAGAGLQDVTAQDVQEIIPLVLDYAPAMDMAAFESGLAGLPVGTGAEGAIQQLQAVAFAAQERSDHPDHPEHANHPDHPGHSEHSADEFASTFTTDSAFGTFYGASAGSSEGVAGVGSLSGEEFTGAGAFAAGTDGVAGSIDTTGEDFGLTFAGSGNEDNFAVAGASSSPLGDYDLAASGTPREGELPSLPVDEIGDPGLDLDTEALDGAVDAASGTVAGYVAQGGDAFAAQVSDGSHTLGEYLTSGGAMAGDAISNGGDAVADEISHGAHRVSDQVASAGDAELPTDEGLPAEIPSEVPTDLDVDLPTDDLPIGDLPTDDLGLGDLPAGDVPTELPELPVANPMPAERADLPELGQLSDNLTVPELSSESPVGGLVSPDQASLPELGSTVPGELELGQ